VSLKVGVLMGGASEERDVSLSTGKAVADACRSNGYITREFEFQLNYKKLLKDFKSQDIIFNALHGGIGENGEIQLWLDKYSIPYTGSGSLASALCMDKAKSKKIAREQNILTPKWELLSSPNQIPQMDYPFVIKPNDQGSTVGLKIMTDNNNIHNALEGSFNHGNLIMVEEYIEGRELTVTVLDGKSYPIIEIEPTHELYDYECKYVPGMTNYTCPAKIEDELTQNIMKDTELLFRELGCDIYGRADYILDERGNYFFLEMNTLPGMTGTSLVPKSVQVAGMSFDVLIKNIIELSI